MANQDQPGEIEPLSLFRQARAASSRGDLAEAEAVCRTIIADRPAHPPASIMLCEIVLRRGEYDSAMALMAPVLEAHPTSPAVQFAVANTLHIAGRLQDAVTHFEAALALEPAFPGAWNNLGLVLWQAGEYERALAAFSQALALDADLAEARLNLAGLELEIGSVDRAVDNLNIVIQANPASAKAHYRLGLALRKRRDHLGALQCQLMAVSLAPDMVEAHIAAGLATCAIGRADLAFGSFHRAIELDPDSTLAWHACGVAMRALGRFDEARAAFERVVALDPAHGEGYRALASIGAEDPTFGNEPALRAIIEDPVESNENRASAGLALAKRLEDAGRFDEAFEAARQANHLTRLEQLRRGIKCDHAGFAAANTENSSAFTADFLAEHRHWASQSELPVFIVGFPRSGTTLVEQILSAHSRVHGAGELSAIRRQAKALRETHGHPKTWPKTVVRAISAAHLDHLQSVGGPAQRVIDKAPDNLFELGFIALMFPQARIIFCQRDGRDAALSVFFNRFAIEAAYTTDLVDAGRRWGEAQRVTAQWLQAPLLQTFVVDYRQLVTRFEPMARDLVSFLGLAWEAACLDYQHVERTVFTPSSWQVRQPIYTGSLDRWRRYARHLGPLNQALDSKA